MAGIEPVETTLFNILTKQTSIPEGRDLLAFLHACDMRIGYLARYKLEAEDKLENQDQWYRESLDKLNREIEYLKSLKMSLNKEMREIKNRIEFVLEEKSLWKRIKSHFKRKKALKELRKLFRDLGVV